MQNFPEPTPAASTVSEPPRRRGKGKRGLALVGTGAGALVLGIVLGSAAAGGTPEPETRTVTEIKTETEYVDRVPASCIDSTDSGEALVQQIAGYLGAESDAWTAASTFDASTLSAASDVKQIESDKLVSAVENYLADARSCKGASS